MNIRADEQFYAYADFLPPGRHNYAVISQKKGQRKLVFHHFTLTQRSDDVQVTMKRTKKLRKTRRFHKDKSVFKEWKEDTGMTIEKAFDTDYNAMKLNRFIKNPTDVSLFVLIWQLELVIERLKDSYLEICEVFLTCASKSNYPGITWLDF